MKKRIVIVGGVAGGASCAARLRRLDETAEIVLLERGRYISYANCGLPYYIGDVIRDRDALLLQTPEAMRAKYNIDVRIRHEAVSIDREKKTVSVLDIVKGETYAQPYDALVLAAGSSPLKPPIPGIDSPHILPLWTVPDTDRIRSEIRERGVRDAVVIGGGFIGIEMAENLDRAGVSVTLIEAQKQVMAPFDFEMALLLHEHLTHKGVCLILGDGVSSFEERNGRTVVTLNSGRQIEAGLVVLAVGVTPNGKLAREAGLAVNAKGGVITDEFLRTSDRDIYAVGDMIEVEDFIGKGRVMIPLAGPANKQGRIAADNIMGARERYNGTQGTSVAKVFDLTAAATGANEKTLVSRGLKKGQDYESIIIVQNSHASYYPCAVPMTVKLLFSADGSSILGAQIVGGEGADKRIDVIAAAIRLGAAVGNLKELELAYAPPYSSAKDPVNMAGFVAENLLSGKVSFAEWDVLEKDPDALVLDVREDTELAVCSVPGAKHIPLGQLRGRLGELDRERRIIVFCAVGVRAYNAARILSCSGFSHVCVYPGGMRFYLSTHCSGTGAPAPEASCTGCCGGPVG